LREATSRCVGLVRIAAATAALEIAFATVPEADAMLDNRAAPSPNIDVRYEPVAFSDLPGWDEDDHAAALTTFLASCAVLKDKGRTSRKGRIRDRLARLCQSAPRSRVDAAAARRFFETHFTPHHLVAATTGFLTGYYEPELDGALEKGNGFDVPLLGRPDDLIDLVERSLHASANEQLAAGRRDRDKIVPYFTRAEIENGALDGRGLEIAYLRDPIDAFLLHVQGSGRIRLSDGRVIRVGYAGKNGFPYTSIGGVLVNRGVAPAEEMTLDRLRDWLAEDAARGRALMQENRSYIFFRRLPDGDDDVGPLGAQGVALTEGRSLAVDASYHPLGLPIFIVSGAIKHHGSSGFHRLMVAQDVGSAIRGPERGDIFWGTGKAAERLAGQTRHAGRFFALFPRGVSP
jgi:membrane-bound lytic murein transglycosylase A